MVLGDPGCGKSTLVNWIAWQLAQDRPNDWTKRLDRRIPLPLIVRDLGIRPGITWDALLDTFLGLPVGKHLARDHLVRLLVDGAVFVLLDGLDEIGNLAVRRDLRDAVQDGMQRYDKCRWLLTSRIVGYEHVPFHIAPRSESARMGRRTDELLSAPDALASVQHVAPFNDEQIARFAAHWYAEREADPVRAEGGAKNLVDAVHADPATTRLARIPNLLTIMTLIHRTRARLPNGKALLYNEIAQAYLETIDDYRKLRETNDTLADKKRWLARVGFEMQLQRSAASSGEGAQEADREVLVPGDRLHAWLAKGMQASGRHVDEGDPARFIDHIKRRSGLMIERSDGQFAFTHLSFQEYFAACYLRERITSPGWILKKNIAPGTSATDLKRYAGKDIWREALVFLFELIANEVPDWKETLWKGVFGRDWQSVASTDLKKRATVCLLARLAVDPHAGLDEVLHEQAVQCCLQWELKRQKVQGARVYTGPPEVLRILLSVDPHDQIRYLGRLADVAQAANIRHLNLSHTGVTDLGPLERLTGLQELDLSNTGVTDLRPLERLTGLQWLYLGETGVTDLGPLERLTGLQSLDLRLTRVTDLGPLERLTGLQWLDLSRHPRDRPGSAGAPHRTEIALPHRHRRDRPGAAGAPHRTAMALPPRHRRDRRGGHKASKQVAHNLDTKLQTELRTTLIS